MFTRNRQAAGDLTTRWQTVAIGKGGASAAGPRPSPPTLACSTDSACESANAVRKPVHSCGRLLFCRLSDEV